MNRRFFLAKFICFPKRSSIELPKQPIHEETTRNGRRGKRTCFKTEAEKKGRRCNVKISHNRCSWRFG